jgi:hypothetical protein
MSSRVFIGGDQPQGRTKNDTLRQGIEISSPAYLRGAAFPKVLPNSSPGLIRRGSTQATFETRVYDDTLNVPHLGQLDSLSLDSPQAYTKINLQIEQRDLGQLGETDADTDAGDLQPFRESAKFDPVDFLNAAFGSYYPMSQLQLNTYFGNPYRSDGVIEPLTIRAEAAFSTIEFPQIARSIKGDMQGAHGEDVLRTACPIESSFKLQDILEAPLEPFFDAGPVHLGDGAMPEPGFVESTGHKAAPKSDTSDKLVNANRYDDPEISALMLESSAGPHDVYPSPGTLLATAGQQVRPTQLIGSEPLPGTDSIAFVGLRR